MLSRVLLPQLHLSATTFEHCNMTNDHEQVARWQDDLLPHMVDRLAHERPDIEYAEWVTGSNVVAINYAQLANIVNGLAWWLVKQLGGPGPHGPNPDVLTYVGPNDVRYSALALAAVKAGYVVRICILPIVTLIYLWYVANQVRI